MGNVVKNNMPSLSALNQLNTNNTLLGKALKKVSSGMKINSAADNASAYSISESMRVQLRSLEQCNANTKTGANMVAIAEGAIDNQIDILKRMKEIALDAANDSNTDSDRAIMQKEVNSRLMELNNISYSTEYNGRQLLNGAVPGVQKLVFDTQGAMKDNTIENVVPDASDPSMDSTYRTNDNGGYGITGYGPYSYTYATGTMYDPNTTVYNQLTSIASSASVVYDSSGNAYPTTKDPSNPTGPLCVQISGAYQIIVDSSGNDSQGNPQTGTVFSGYAAPQYAAFVAPQPAFNTMVALSPAVGSSIVNYTQDYKGNAIVEGQANSGINTGSLSSYELDFTNVTGAGGAALNVPADLNDQGFSIMCDGCGQFVSIKFDTNIPVGSGTYASAPAGGSEAYVVGIGGLTNINDLPAAIYDGISAANKSTSNPVVVTSYHDVQIDKVTDPVTGVDKYYLTKDGPRFVLYNGFKGELKTVGGMLPQQDVVIQGDTVSSQFTRLHLPNTTLAALFPTDDSTWDIEPTKEDYPNPWPNGYDEDRTWPAAWGEDYLKSASLEDKRKRLWREETWPYPVKGAISTATCVSTREKAVKFISSLDQALKYLTNAATTLGVQEVRLNYMNDNIVTSHENTTAAESVIRDADMASEMTNYTKYNVLMQSAQSMLSQSNQNLGSSLDLLK